jgi:hypothetical protein
MQSEKRHSLAQKALKQLEKQHHTSRKSHAKVGANSAGALVELITEMEKDLEKTLGIEPLV